MDGTIDGVGEPMSLSAAATRLGITQAAVRKRIKRGTLAADKGEDGTWTVWITGEEPVKDGEVDSSDDGTPYRDELITSMKAEIGFLRSELRRVGEEKAESDRRRDVLFSQFGDQLKALTQTTTDVQSQVEAVAHEIVSEPASVVEEKQSPVSWWRRVFLGES
jgi:hypothetical protein